MSILENDKCYYDLSQCRYFLWKCSERLRECRRKQKEILSDIIEFSKNTPEDIELGKYKNENKQCENTIKLKRKIYKIKCNIFNTYRKLNPKEVEKYFLLIDQEEQLLDHEEILKQQEKYLSAREEIFNNNVTLED